MKKIVTLNDGSKMEAGLTGNPSGKVIMLPIAKKPVYGQQAESLKRWGADPELGEHFIEGLSDQFQVLYFDYEGHLFENPQPDQLTPDHMTKDFLLIADEMKVDTFSYYGYSWLALAGLQLAIRTNRLESLMMGGFPPYEGPYKEMLIVTEKTHGQALKNPSSSKASIYEENTAPDAIDWDHIQITLDPKQTQQFVTLYQNLMDFDDTSIQYALDFPKLAFAGEKDTIVYGESFGSVTVDMIGILQKNKQQLEQWGWDVAILEGGGMDHTQAMQPNAVLPLIKPWLMEHL
ncbi:hypothetical protein BBD42_12710 [Paenibacillus sp. BIHB 4019]|uniref:Alpha/beta hydrolase n=1 Tax=Paenibacillus sp. BIHB 4019 TaxID=1870819 RepID=A0A1B2DHM9_9BACL|nr:alpha/beta hydrolase [Paenibacillus sp. BIHB 4019]ANY67232.1 hypothetical protein BBD42_12710 [Paenibacillus sp. BIHB 4019]